MQKINAVYLTCSLLSKPGLPVKSQNSNAYLLSSDGDSYKGLYTTLAHLLAFSGSSTFASVGLMSLFESMYCQHS